MSDTPKETAPEPTPRELRQATVWRVLRLVYLRFLARDIGRRPVDLSDAETNALLDPWLDAMKRDLVVLNECMDQAFAAGAGDANGRLHASEVHPVAAHDLLDDLIDPHDTAEEAALFPGPRHAAAERVEKK